MKRLRDRGVIPRDRRLKDGREFERLDRAAEFGLPRQRDQRLARKTPFSREGPHLFRAVGTIDLSGDADGP